MSIQSSINQALGTVELTLLRTGTITTPLRKYPEKEKSAEKKNAPGALESPKTQETAPKGESAAPTPEKQPVAAQPATPGDLMISGDQMAAQMAAGRVAAKTQQIQKGKLGRQERLDMLRAKREDLRKLKQEISGLETAFKKPSKGGAK
jgi:hypothetical protein